MVAHTSVYFTTMYSCKRKHKELKIFNMTMLLSTMVILFMINSTRDSLIKKAPSLGLEVTQFDGTLYF
jgi:hypothetical protein